MAILVATGAIISALGVIRFDILKAIKETKKGG